MVKKDQILEYGGKKIFMAKDSKNLEKKWVLVCILPSEDWFSLSWACFCTYRTGGWTRWFLKPHSCSDTYQLFGEHVLTVFQELSLMLCSRKGMCGSYFETFLEGEATMHSLATGIQACLGYLLWGMRAVVLSIIHQLFLYWLWHRVKYMKNIEPTANTIMSI